MTQRLLTPRRYAMPFGSKSCIPPRKYICRKQAVYSVFFANDLETFLRVAGPSSVHNLRMIVAKEVDDASEE